MRQGIHPEYRTVAFRDAATGTVYRTRSTITSTEVIELDGETLPLVAVDTSSASHPFWTGSARVLDTAGRVEKFERRYGKRG
ncbi:large subunit ribosomal protein L31 [Klenkia soli]|uniref:50S ribosomal protein L31 n=1 Tax=Klenkia soli TaxID=1052260 RepID=A0A1H0RVU7_9ACTN|nr:type B 50S ribosomal protein L31 [Klenkia soli]SDP33533.1 large subunit ribosomal protein L31 [Klenkia soli]